VANFFLGQSIGIDETYKCQLKFFFSLGGLCPLEWAWQIFFGSIDRY